MESEALRRQLEALADIIGAALHGTWLDFTRWGLALSLLLLLVLLILWLLLYALEKTAWLNRRPVLSLSSFLFCAALCFWLFSPERPCFFPAERHISPCRAPPPTLHLKDK